MPSVDPPCLSVYAAVLVSLSSYAFQPLGPHAPQAQRAIEFVGLDNREPFYRYPDEHARLAAPFC
jgi:hypothetical protein